MVTNDSSLFIMIMYYMRALILCHHVFANLILAYFCFVLQEASIKSLRKYGVGSCGPRGFYGTIGGENRI